MPMITTGYGWSGLEGFETKLIFILYVLKVADNIPCAKSLCQPTSKVAPQLENKYSFVHRSTQGVKLTVKEKFKNMESFETLILRGIGNVYKPDMKMAVLPHVVLLFLY